jgi:hypothetical protein
MRTPIWLISEHAKSSCLQFSFQLRQARSRYLYVVLGLSSAKSGNEIAGPSLFNHTASPAELAGHGRPRFASAIFVRIGHLRSFSAQSIGETSSDADMLRSPFSHSVRGASPLELMDWTRSKKSSRTINSGLQAKEQLRSRCRKIIVPLLS